MINKVKTHIIKNSLGSTEREIFESLCKNTPNNSLQENKAKAIDYAKSLAVKQHHLGEIFKDKILRDALLSEPELELMNKGMSTVNEFYKYQAIIEKMDYKILCSPDSMKTFLLECDNIRKVEKTITMLEKELEILKKDIKRKSLSRHKTSNSNEVSIEELDETQKESLARLGIRYSEVEKISLSKLKKLYNQKLYGTSYSSIEESSKDNLAELSQAFFNVKKAFNASC